MIIAVHPYDSIFHPLCKVFVVFVKGLENADVILYAVGERQQDTGEDTSKTRIELTDQQVAQLRRLHSLGKPVAMLLFCGRPLILTDVLPYCDAVLNVWFPGSEGAAAIRALVMGDENPSREDQLMQQSFARERIRALVDRLAQQDE